MAKTSEQNERYGLGSALIEWTPPRGMAKWTFTEGSAMVAAMRATGERPAAFARRHGLLAARVQRWVERVDRRSRTTAVVPATACKPRIVGRPRIPSPTRSEIYLDIEGQGINNTTDAVLFGLLIRRGSRTTYWKSLANSSTDGRRAWREFCQKVRTLPSDCPVFHFGSYDAQLVRGLHVRYGGAKDLEGRLFDLHLAIANHVAVPSRRTTLKAIAEALGIRSAEPGASGSAWDTRSLRGSDSTSFVAASN